MQHSVFWTHTRPSLQPTRTAGFHRFAPAEWTTAPITPGVCGLARAEQHSNGNGESPGVTVLVYCPHGNGSVLGFRTAFAPTLDNGAAVFNMKSLYHWQPGPRRGGYRFSRQIGASRPLHLARIGRATGLCRCGALADMINAVSGDVCRRIAPLIEPEN